MAYLIKVSQQGLKGHIKAYVNPAHVAKLQQEGKHTAVSMATGESFVVTDEIDTLARKLQSRPTGSPFADCGLRHPFKLIRKGFTNLAEVGDTFTLYGKGRNIRGVHYAQLRHTANGEEITVLETETNYFEF